MTVTTALQLVNYALTELREKTVTDFTATYSIFVLQQVNKAKRVVEDTRPWNALRKVITFTTADGTETYNLGDGGVGSSDTNERSYLVKDESDKLGWGWNRASMMYDTTNKTQLWDYPAEIMRGDSQLALLQNALPQRYSLIQSATGITVRIYPKPNGAYSMSSTWVVPQADLSAVSDVLLVPAAPVWLLAAAYCAEERGDGQGQRADALYQQARDALSDAIQYGTDINELVAYPV